MHFLNAYRFENSNNDRFTLKFLEHQQLRYQKPSTLHCFAFETRTGMYNHNRPFLWWDISVLAKSESHVNEQTFSIQLLIQLSLNQSNVSSNHVYSFSHTFTKIIRSIKFLVWNFTEFLVPHVILWWFDCIAELHNLCTNEVSLFTFWQSQSLCSKRTESPHSSNNPTSSYIAVQSEGMSILS